MFVLFVRIEKNNKNLNVFLNRESNGIAWNFIVLKKIKSNICFDFLWNCCAFNYNTNNIEYNWMIIWLCVC